MALDTIRLPPLLALVSTSDQTLAASHPPRGWSGTVTFTYDITDGVGNDTATVTLNVPAPPALPPLEYNYTVPYNSNFTGPKTVLDDLKDQVPNANLTVVDVNPPPANTGNVTVYPNGSYVFVPATNWTGECKGA